MKAKKLSVKEIALLAIAGGFAWSKLGLGVAVKEVAPSLVTPLTPPTPECPDGYRVAWNSSKNDWECIPRL